MVNAQVQLRFVALLYAMFAPRISAGSAWSGRLPRPPRRRTLADQVATRWASAIPDVATRAIECLLLSGLSLFFLKLGRSLRIVTVAGSLLLSFLIAWTAARHSAEVAPLYLALEPPDHKHLAIDWGM